MLLRCLTNVIANPIALRSRLLDLQTKAPQLRHRMVFSSSFSTWNRRDVRVEVKCFSSSSSLLPSPSINKKSIESFRIFLFSHHRELRFCTSITNYNLSTQRWWVLKQFTLPSFLEIRKENKKRRGLWDHHHHWWCFNHQLIRELSSRCDLIKEKDSLLLK